MPPLHCRKRADGQNISFQIWVTPLTCALTSQQCFLSMKASWHGRLICVCGGQRPKQRCPDPPTPAMFVYSHYWFLLLCLFSVFLQQIWDKDVLICYIILHICNVILNSCKLLYDADIVTDNSVSVTMASICRSICFLSLWYPGLLVPLPRAHTNAHARTDTHLLLKEVLWFFAVVTKERKQIPGHVKLKLSCSTITEVVTEDHLPEE